MEKGELQQPVLAQPSIGTKFCRLQWLKILQADGYGVKMEVINCKSVQLPLSWYLKVPSYGLANSCSEAGCARSTHCIAKDKKSYQNHPVTVFFPSCVRERRVPAISNLFQLQAASTPSLWPSARRKRCGATTLSPLTPSLFSERYSITASRLFQR